MSINVNNLSSMVYFIFIGLRSLVDVLVVVLAGITLFPGILLFSVWKVIVTFFAKHFKSGLIPLSATDAYILHGADKDIYRESTSMNLNIGVACTLNGIVDGKEFFQNILDKVVKVKPPYKKDDPHIRFHQCVQRFGGYWFFKTFKNELRYEDHVTVMTLPSDSSFEEEVAKWLKIRYDGSCPLWGILLIHRPSTEETFAACKLHHVLGDGYSMLHLMDLITDTKFNYQVKEENYTYIQKLARGLTSAFGELPKTLLLPKTLFSQREEEDIFITQAILPLSTIKEIRRKALVHFGAVMFYLVRNYIFDLMHEVCTPEADFPTEITIATSLPMPNHPPTTLCNHATVASFFFKANKQPGVLSESLVDIENNLTEYFTNFTHKAMVAINVCLSPAPFWLVNLIPRTALMDRIGVAYVHMLGAEKYEKVFQYDMKDIQAFLMHPRQKGVNVVCLTTGDEIIVNIVGPKYMFPTQDRAKEFTQQSFHRNLNNLLANVEPTIVVQ